MYPIDKNVLIVRPNKRHGAYTILCLLYKKRGVKNEYVEPDAPYVHQV